MAMIPLKNTYTVCPEGIHVFKIDKVEYDETFGKMQIHLVTEKGIKLVERFSMLNADGTYNDKACNAFSYFAKTALNNYEIENVDPLTLTGHYIKAEVKHTKVPSNNDPAKILTFANLGDKWVADGFETEKETVVPEGFDLDAFLKG